MVKSERSKVPEEAQTQSPGGGPRTPPQLKGSPVGKAGPVPAGRKGTKQSPSPMVSTFLGREVRLSDTDVEGWVKGLRHVRKL